LRQHQSDRFPPIEQMRLVQFDGNSWQPIGDVIERVCESAE
jgi:hypothetical protein